LINYPLASSTWDQQEKDALYAVIDSGKHTMGEQVAAYEQEFAAKFGSSFALMVNSGSSANLILLAGLRYRERSVLQPGDEVIVPAVSWSTTYYPVNQVGGILSFVDIDPNSLNIDLKKVEQAITKKTKAILAVNLLGNPSDLVNLKLLADSHNLILIEDNCESLGASIGGKQCGTFGIGGTFSSFFSHHISTMEGGMILTDDQNLYEAMKSLRAHGWTRDLPEKNSVHDKSGKKWDDLFRFVLPGYNFRPLEMEAAVGRIQIKKIDTFIEQRRANAVKFKECLAGIPNLRIQQEIGNSSWFGFAIILDGKLRSKRRELIDLLDDAKIESRPIVAGNFTKNPVMKHLTTNPVPSLPVADWIHEDGLFIGNHHYELTAQIENLANVLQDFEGSI
jgi:CDP-6-deoxy-D-xylo-4-hexulose-3-dehydrase